MRVVESPVSGYIHLVDSMILESAPAPQMKAILKSNVRKDGKRPKAIAASAVLDGHCNGL